MSDLSDLFKVIAEGKKHYEDTDPKGKLKKQIREEIKAETKVGLADLMKELASLKEQAEQLEQEEQPVTAKVEDQITDAVTVTPIPPEPIVEDMGWGQNDIQQYVKSDAFKQAKTVTDVAKQDSPELKTLKDKIKMLEQWVGRIASTGPGSGAAEIYNLDMPTKTVTGDYTVDRKDYYIGVDCNVKSYITLPQFANNVKNGRIIVIKDESGHAQLTPIKIVGTIDNDPNGAEIRINNGAVQLLYSNGQWRII